MKKIYPVVMCGGSGTRLWPISRNATPKQYQPIVTEKSMLRETVVRFPLGGNLNVAPPSFVCAVSHEKHILKACKEENLDPNLIILEPCPRNTAAVAASVAVAIEKQDEDALILLLPADHHIDDVEAFRSYIKAGVVSAQNGALVTFGIKPEGPETGYGYIRSGKSTGNQVFEVEAFVEKPNLETAQHYLKSGDYSWNAGIFLFTPRDMLNAFETHAPKILSDSRKAVERGITEKKSLFLDPVSFTKCENESIDYAIMEKAQNVHVVAPVNIGWSDIGSWDSLRYRALINNKLTEGTGDIITIDCLNTLVRSDGPTVAVLGVKDLVIVATEDAILISKAGETQNVKKVVEDLKSREKYGVI